MFRLRRPRSPLHTARRAVAALLAVVALLLALRSPALPAAGRSTGVAVAVAATDLPSGTVLAAAALTLATFPDDVTPAGTVNEPTPLVGRVLAGAVRAGEPITDARLVGPGLTSGLPRGTVAAPVRLADLAVTALVRTGDRVDILATSPDAGSAEVIAAGALVLAAPTPAASPGTPSPADDAAGLLVLAVDGPTAARLAAVATTATLTVSLPPP